MHVWYSKQLMKICSFSNYLRCYELNFRSYQKTPKNIPYQRLRPLSVKSGNLLNGIRYFVLLQNTFINGDLPPYTIGIFRQTNLSQEAIRLTACDGGPSTGYHTHLNT